MKRQICLFYKHLLLMCVLFLGLSSRSMAQSFPDFKIRTPSGKVLSSLQLSLNKPTVIIVFSPGCGHCKVLIESIFKRITSFKKASIILATFVKPGDIIAFEKKYQTAKYPNITVGTDEPVFFLQKYYQLTSTPFTILYDKNRKLIASYKSEHIADDLIKKLEKLH